MATLDNRLLKTLAAESPIRKKYRPFKTANTRDHVSNHSYSTWLDHVKPILLDVQPVVGELDDVELQTALASYPSLREPL